MVNSTTEMWGEDNGSGTRSLTCDADGKTMDDGMRTGAWNARNRLTDEAIMGTMNRIPQIAFAGFICAAMISCSGSKLDPGQALVELGFDRLPTKECRYRRTGRNRAFEFICTYDQFSDWLTNSSVFYEVSGHYADEKPALQRAMNSILEIHGYGYFLDGEFIREGKNLNAKLYVTSTGSEQICSVEVDIFLLDP